MEASVYEARARKHFAERSTRIGECLVFIGSQDKEGYGRFFYQGMTRRAHRVAYFWKTGRWPALVRHSCDNPPCVEPEHLLEGTQQDNLDDAYSRGRKCELGGLNPNAKLTDDQVRALRRRSEAGESHLALAAEFDINYTHLSQIVNRRLWAHVV